MLWVPLLLSALLPQPRCVCALSLPSVAPWAHSGRWHLCPCPVPGARLRGQGDNDPPCPAPTFTNLAQGSLLLILLLILLTTPGTSPEAGRSCFPSLSLLEGLSLQTQHLLAGISSGVARCPRAGFSPVPTSFLPCTQICPKTTCLSSLLFLLPPEA